MYPKNLRRPCSYHLAANKRRNAKATNQLHNRRENSWRDKRLEDAQLNATPQPQKDRRLFAQWMIVHGINQNIIYVHEYDFNWLTRRNMLEQVLDRKQSIRLLVSEVKISVSLLSHVQM